MATAIDAVFLFLAFVVGAVFALVGFEERATAPFVWGTAVVLTVILRLALFFGIHITFGGV